MSKQTILGRIGQLIRANVNSLIDSAEDPKKMLDQMVRDFTNSIAEAEGAVAQTIGNLRMLEQDHKEDVDSAKEWGTKALAASRKGDELRTAGDATGADKFDALARVALQRQLQHEQEAKETEPQLASQRQVVDQLKNGLVTMRQKLTELQSKRDSLAARQKSVEARATVQDSIKSINIQDPTSEISRFEDKIRREEARVSGMEEIQASSLDAQFESLEDVGQLTEVEARLAALKTGQTAQLGAASEPVDAEAVRIESSINSSNA